MIVHVRLYATLRKHLPDVPHGKSVPITLGEGATIADLFVRLNIPREQIKTAFVRGVVRDDGFVLRDGDEVGIFPPIAGGSRAATG